MPYGTHSVLDTLAASQQTIAQFGEDNAFGSIEIALVAHNRIQADLVSDLVERTTDRLRRYGGDADMTMEELDEFGRADAQKITAGANVGFPLRLYGRSLQWTRKFFQNTNGQELAASVSGMMKADTQAVTRELKRAIFTPTNSTFIDRLIDHVELPVKAFVNADDQPIPPGPNGETFDASSHTHYLARVSTLAASDINGVIGTVREHHNVGRAQLYISETDEAAVRAFTDNFVAIQPFGIVDNRTTLQAVGTLDTDNSGDRRIGFWLPYNAEVWVKPWVPANYMVATNAGAPPPLVWRTRNAGDLELVADDELHPLRARSYEREFGIGVWTRTNGAVLFIGGTSYTAPSL